MLQGSFVDSYNNMTLKTLNILTWYAKKCDHIPYLLKTDDDMYINTDNLYKFATTQLEKPLNGVQVGQIGDWIIGFMHKKAKPFRNPHHKYYVPEQLFRGSVYPNFVSGTAYLLSRNNIYNKHVQK